jgi:hypothetical protein
MSTLISIPSFRSLFLQVHARGQDLGQATGFIAKLPRSTRRYLVTNRHVVTGRHEETGECLDTKHAALPDAITITHNSSAGIGYYVPERIELYRDGGPDDGGIRRWVEHPVQTSADVVVIPLEEGPDRTLHHYDVLGLTEHLIEPGSVVNIVGFPYGQRTGGFAIWSTGFVASEPQLNHHGEPMFLVDCRSRKGQSGSPVITFTGGHGAFLKPDERNVNVGTIHLLGVYSGRLNDDSDLGRVWKSWLLAELIEVADLRP